MFVSNANIIIGSQNTTSFYCTVVPNDGRNRIDETKKPHNKITTPYTTLSTIPHPGP
jgi:hypothetical protein